MFFLNTTKVHCFFGFSKFSLILITFFNVSIARATNTGF
nr:MAG TPA: hypothetical protein [Bacteriophage sp.]